MRKLQLQNPTILYKLSGFKDPVLQQSPSKEIDDEMIGHQKFISNYRNKVKHRNSPSVTIFSPFDHNIRLQMRFVNY